MNENIDDSTKESNTADGDEKDTILEEGSVKSNEGDKAHKLELEDEAAQLSEETWGGPHTRVRRMPAIIRFTNWLNNFNLRRYTTTTDNDNTTTKTSATQKKLGKRKEKDYIIQMDWIILLGDSGFSGKTSVWVRYLKGIYLESPIATIGIDYGIKYTTINNRQYKIMIWDTAGHDRFLSHTRTMFRKKAVFYLIYDVTSKESFENIKKKWLPIAQDICSGEFYTEDRKLLEKKLRVFNTNIGNNVKSIYPLICLVGNKSDVPDEDRKVTYEEGMAFAKVLNSPFYEISAKENININESFAHLIECMHGVKPYRCNDDKNLIITRNNWSPSVHLSCCSAQREIIHYLLMWNYKANDNVTLPNVLFIYIFTYLQFCVDEKTWYTLKKWLSLDPLKQPMLSFFSSKTDGGMKRTKAVNDREEYANKQCNKNTKKCCVM